MVPGLNWGWQCVKQAPHPSCLSGPILTSSVLRLCQVCSGLTPSCIQGPLLTGPLPYLHDRPPFHFYLGFETRPSRVWGTRQLSGLAEITVPSAPRVAAEHVTRGLTTKFTSYSFWNVNSRLAQQPPSLAN